MILRSLTLDYFRNYVHMQAGFDPRVNLIYGDNAQGKTNLLEAIAYLSSAKSHRTRFDRELIMMGVDSAFLKGEIQGRGRDFTLEADLFRGRGRQLRSNGVRLKTAAELSGILTTVLFCPEDLYLIREGAAARRKFLDAAICQLRPRYAAALAEYNRLYDHKTRILRDWQEEPSLLQTLDDFNLRMAQTGAILIHYRAHFVKRLQEHAPAIHGDFSGARERLGLEYATVSTVDDPLKIPRELLPRLLEHQESHRRAELDARQCLKLAQREIMEEETGQWPVLLLDDVLSELDAKRQSFVLNRIKGGQLFITCCEEEKLEGLEGGRAFQVKNGAFIAQ